MPQPATHIVHVAVEVRDPPAGAEVRLPVWIPGSYMVREFARHVQSFEASDEGGRPLAWRKTRKDAWTIENGPGRPLRLEFDFYANELTVRTSHVDATHAFINTANLLPYLPGRTDAPSSLEVQIPPSWRVHSGLRREKDSNVFLADDYDELADSPLHAGPEPSVEFKVEGISHTIAPWGRGNMDLERLAADVERIVAAEAAVFGGLPYGRYCFILLLTDGGRGGLEHRGSTALMVPRFSFRAAQLYERVLQLVAHEFFHTWNVKRIHPEWRTGSVDYAAENYTGLLWAMEGITDYYSPLTLRRAGLISPERYLELLGDQMSDLAATPGRHLQSLEEASFDAWIKYYRPDEHSANSSVSYYLKGGLASLVLDLEMRRRTAGERSLDDLMRFLWEGYGRAGQGVPEDGFRPAVEAVAGGNWRWFFEQAIGGRGDLDYAPGLAAVGLGVNWRADPKGPEAWLGLRLRTEAGRAKIATVLSDGPAWGSGLSAGDELLALDGFRVDESGLDDRLRDYAPRDVVRLTVFRRDELVEVRLTLGARPPTRASLKKIRRANVRQRELYESWLGAPW